MELYDDDRGKIMDIKYYREFSQCLQRETELKVYGGKGAPVLYFVNDEENQMVHDCLMDMAGANRVQIFEIANPLSVIDEKGNYDHASYLLEQYYYYIVHEVIPNVFRLNTRSNNGQRQQGVYTVGEGCVSGAAVNYFLRRPDIFLGTLSLNGIFNLSFYFGDFVNKNIYDNCPTIYLSKMDENHPYIKRYNDLDKIYILNSQEPRTVDSAKELQKIMDNHNIKAHVLLEKPEEKPINIECVRSCLEDLLS